MTITHDDIIRSLEALSPDEMEVFLARLMERAGISLPAVSAPVVFTMGAPPRTEEEHEYELRLLDHGADKILVIKLVRELKGLGLKETRDLVESAPAVIVEGLTRARALEIQQRFTAAGAKVELV